MNHTSFQLFSEILTGVTKGDYRHGICIEDMALVIIINIFYNTWPYFDEA